MNVYIFQSVPEKFDVRSELKSQGHYTWYATRYLHLMQPDDIVLFWMGGDPKIRGLYGWGRLKSKPYLKDDWDEQGVDVTCEVRFEHPILATSLRDDSVLRSMLILRAPVGTNFLLTEEEAKRLIVVIKDSGKPAPNLDV